MEVILAGQLLLGRNYISLTAVINYLQEKKKREMMGIFSGFNIQFVSSCLEKRLS